MYTGRSVGRLIEWLRRLMPNKADYVTFGYEDGSVRYHDEIVVQKIEWDEYDTPTFDFVHEGYNEIQARRRDEILLSERTILHHRLEDAELEALAGLGKEPYRANGTRPADMPDPLRALLKKGLVTEEQTGKGWDEEGNFICNITIEITPQAKGFLQYLNSQEGQP